MYLFKDLFMYARLLMVSKNIRSLAFGNGRLQFILCVCIVLIGGIVAFPASFIGKSNVIIGLLMIPFVLLCSEQKRFNSLYFLCVILFGAFALRYNIRIAYFFTLVFFILFLIDLIVGATSKLMFFLVIFMSPVFEQASVIIGFPIRLQLSAIAGELLSYLGMGVQVDGNVVVMRGDNFMVDDACMGLNMLAFSMLMGVFMIAYRCHRENREMHLLKTFLFFQVVLVVNIFCNLLRILVLIIFRIAPEDPMHEMAGILCFVMYVMIPLYFLSPWPLGEVRKTTEGYPIALSWAKSSSLIAFAILILMIGIKIDVKRSQPTATEAATFSLKGFQEERMKDGITKLYNKEALIYIKPIPEFFSSEHTPLYCWRGTGYTFESIRLTIINGYEVYTGQLVKPGHTLQTAWWYSNGEAKTVDQLNWRFRMLKGEPRFCVVNVTAENEDVLLHETKRLLNEKLIVNN